MITMKKLGVVKEAPSEEDAAKLARQGFERVGGEAAPAADRPATMKDLHTVEEAIYAHIGESFLKMSEAVYNRLYSELTATAPGKPKTAKASKKEEPHGGADQPDRADGAK